MQGFPQPMRGSAEKQAMCGVLSAALATSAAQAPRSAFLSVEWDTMGHMVLVVCSAGLCAKGGDVRGRTHRAVFSIGTLAAPPTHSVELGFRSQTSFPAGWGEGTFGQVPSLIRGLLTALNVKDECWGLSPIPSRSPLGLCADSLTFLPVTLKPHGSRKE